MMKREYVSIILPTYNRAKKIGKAIESVLAQSYEKFELIIVDDGSLDDTEDVVKAYNDSRIRYYKLPKNCGQSCARNKGIELAKYKYVAFQDSDDIWLQGKLEAQMYVMQDEESIGMVYHKIRYSMGSGRHFIIPDENVPLDKKSGDIYGQLLWDNLVGMPTILVKKECIEQIGGLDETLNCLEDYDFALRIAKEYKVKFIDEVYLASEFSTTGVSGGDTERYLIASCRLLQKYKADYLATDTFNHRVEIILRDAERLGITEQIIQLMEKLLQL